MYTSLPQITRPTLDYLITRETDKGQKVSSTSGKNSKYRIQAPIENLSLYSEIGLFDERYIYFEPFGEPLDNKSGFLDLREKIVQVAKNFGFPSKMKSGNERKFDQELARTLWTEGLKLGINVSNASLEGTWNYLQGILALDLVAWRWMNWSDKTLNKDRVTSIVRGALSNVWWRYNILTNNGENDYKEWMDILTQDDVAQIIERPRMRGYSPIIIPFAKRITDIRVKQRNDGISSEQATRLIRAAAIRMRIYVGVRNTWYLDEDETDFGQLVDNIFAEAEMMIE